MPKLTCGLLGRGREVTPLPPGLLRNGQMTTGLATQVLPAWRQGKVRALAGTASWAVKEMIHHLRHSGCVCCVCCVTWVGIEELLDVLAAWPPPSHPLSPASPRQKQKAHVPGPTKPPQGVLTWPRCQGQALSLCRGPTPPSWAPGCLAGSHSSHRAAHPGSAGTEWPVLSLGTIFTIFSYISWGQGEGMALPGRSFNWKGMIYEQSLCCHL